MMNFICENCVFFRAKNKFEGHCRKYAPRPITSPGGEVYENFANWPVVDFDEWCGEFLSK